MITPKTFILILIGTFLLGFATMFMYHIINKKNSDTTIENYHENYVEKKAFDSLIADSKVQHIISDKLKSELEYIKPKYDSLILIIKKNGKNEKDIIHTFNTVQFDNWKDSVIKSNKLDK